MFVFFFFFFFQAEDGIRDLYVTGVQTCALPIYRRTAGHGLDRLLDVGERVLRDEPLDREPPLCDEFGEDGDEALGLAVAQRQSHHPLAAEHTVGVERDLCTERRSADDDRRTAGGQGIHSSPEYADIAGGRHHPGRAATSGFLNLGGQVPSPRLDHVGRAEFTGQVEAGRDLVNGNDRGGRRQCRG